MAQTAAELTELYPDDVFEWMNADSRRSAATVVPLVCEFIRPRSVLDLGCATGAWLEAFQAAGAERIRGVDGPWLDPALLTIPRTAFVCHDLNEPWRTEERFDLALCLEMVGHLRESAAHAVIDTLTGAADVVLLSAPVPDQPSLGDGPFLLHWPEYWANAFAARGFVAIDAFRRPLWNRPEVSWWFCQNLIAYVRRERLNDYPAFARCHEQEPHPPLALVHPRMVAAVAGHSEHWEHPVGWLLSALAGALRRRLKRVLVR